LEPDVTATILLFEDDPDVSRLVTDLLREEGYAVYPTRSLGQAASLTGSVRFDLFLADSGAPTKELALRRLRHWCERAGGEVPVIAFTAHNIDRDEARAFGCADAIPKPFDLEDLLSRIGDCIGMRGANGSPGKECLPGPSSPHGTTPARATVARGET
jgi:DNA-binding response OmpR family regulator